MSDNIVDFKKPEAAVECDHDLSKMALMCWNCECMSFIVRADSELECTRCYQVTQAHNGAWRERLPKYDPAMLLPSSEDNVSQHVNVSVEFARAQTMADINKMLERKTLAMVIGYDVHGFGRSWFAASSEDQRMWCLENIDTLRTWVASSTIGEPTTMTTMKDDTQGELNYGDTSSTEG